MDAARVLAGDVPAAGEGNRTILLIPTVHTPSVDCGSRAILALSTAMNLFIDVRKAVAIIANVAAIRAFPQSFVSVYLAIPSPIAVFIVTRSPLAMSSSGERPTSVRRRTRYALFTRVAAVLRMECRISA